MSDVIPYTDQIDHMDFQSKAILPSNDWENILDVKFPRSIAVSLSKDILFKESKNYFTLEGAQWFSTDKNFIWPKRNNNFTISVRHFDFPQMGLFPQKPRAIDKQKLNQIANIYKIDDPDQVYPFLEKSGFLGDVLLEAFSQLQRIFGADMLVDLVLRSDPEEPYQELFGYVHHQGSIEDSHDRLDTFDDEWFLDNLHRTKGLLNFNLAFD